MISSEKSSTFRDHVLFGLRMIPSEKSATFRDHAWSAGSATLEQSDEDEAILPPHLHLVEWSDAWDPAVDGAFRRIRRHRWIRQSLLPHQERPDRSHPRLRAALGDLQGARRGLDHRPGVAWLDAPHRRYAPHDGEGHAQAVVEAAPAQSHGHARRLSSDRFDADQKPPAQGDRGLQAVGSRPLAHDPEKLHFSDKIMRKIKQIVARPDST